MTLAQVELNEGLEELRITHVNDRLNLLEIVRTMRLLISEHLIQLVCSNSVLEIPPCPLRFHQWNALRLSVSNSRSPPTSRDAARPIIVRELSPVNGSVVGVVSGTVVDVPSDVLVTDVAGIVLVLVVGGSVVTVVRVVEVGTVVTVVVVELVDVTGTVESVVVVVGPVVVVVPNVVEVVVVVMPGSAQHRITWLIEFCSTEYGTPGTGSSKMNSVVAAFRISSVQVLLTGGSPNIHVNVPSGIGSILSQVP
jgi:hypothetical protein